jgi:hypothetical protein
MPGIYGMAALTILVAAILSIATLNSLTHSDHPLLLVGICGFSAQRGYQPAGQSSAD